MNADPRIREVLIYWNERADSVVLEVNREQDERFAMSHLLEEIPEDSYIFEFVTTDGIGHYSLSKEVSLEVLGDSYASSLRNRSIASVEQREDGSLALIWESIASNNIQHTTLEYELNGESHSVKVENGETETLLTGLNIGDEVVVFLTFLPPNAFETFDSPRRSYVLE